MRPDATNALGEAAIVGFCALQGFSWVIADEIP
jgi:hypothetical protein